MTWTRVGVISGSTDPALPPGAVARNTPTPTGSQMTLFFGGVDSKDAGNYACVAANPAGVVEAKAQLNVVGKN